MGRPYSVLAPFDAKAQGYTGDYLDLLRDERVFVTDPLAGQPPTSGWVYGWKPVYGWFPADYVVEMPNTEAAQSVDAGEQFFYV